MIAVVMLGVFLIAFFFGSSVAAGAVTLINVFVPDELPVVDEVIQAALWASRFASMIGKKKSVTAYTKNQRVNESIESLKVIRKLPGVKAPGQGLIGKLPGVKRVEKKLESKIVNHNKTKDLDSFEKNDGGYDGY